MLSRQLVRLPLYVACGFVVAFVVLPLLAMLAETVFGAEGIDLSAWKHLLSEAKDREDLLTSMQLGAVAVGVALVFGGGHAWLCATGDLPAGRVLGPLGVLPLAMPPIVIAMGWADFATVNGFWFCSFLVGVAFAPFVAVMTTRGLRSVDGRSYEAALLARGRGAAERLVLRLALPEIIAGALFVFIFAVGEYGVPEFLTVKGKTWHTYAEGIFARWTRRATGAGQQDLVGPIVAAVPLLVIVLVAMYVALKLRARATIVGDFQALPRRELGGWRWPALAIPLVYLGAGVVVPLVVMFRWAMGSTVVNEAMGLATLRDSFQLAFSQAGTDLQYTLLIAALTVLVLVVVGPPLARVASRRFGALQTLSALPVAVPAVLLAVGFVKVYNQAWLGEVYDATFDFYDSVWIVVAAYAARFLPFAVLTMSHANRRLDPGVEEAGRMAGRGSLSRAVSLRLPLLVPAMWSMACLVFVLALRELDVAVVLPAGNGTVVRRLSNVIHFGGESMGGALALLLFAAACVLPVATMILTGRKLRSLS